MLIKEQMRKYKVKMEEITQLEAAESIAFRRLSLLRQNAVSNAGRGFGGGGALWEWGPVGGVWTLGGVSLIRPAHSPSTPWATDSLT